MATHQCKPAPRLQKSKTCQIRYIKVNKTHYEYRTKTQSPYSGCRPIPAISIKGKWLDSAGFAINTPLKIRVMNGCLVITKQ